MLKQFQLSSSIIPADGEERYLGPWVAPNPISIRKIMTWVGSAGQLSNQSHFPAIDVHATVFTGSIVGSFFGLDHYDNFTGPHQWIETYDKGDLVLNQGETVSVGYGSSQLSPEYESFIQILVLVWYEDVN